MAEIDASIPLGVKPVQQPDWMSLASKYADLQTNQLKQQQMRAMQPGIEAQSEQQVAAAASAKIDTARKQWAQDHAQDPKYQLPDGTFDEATYSTDMAKAGNVAGSQELQGKTAANRTARATATADEAKAYAETRKADYQKWLADNSNKYVVPDATAPGGTKLDLMAMGKDAAKAGFGMNAGDILQKHFDLEKQGIDNASSNVDKASKTLKLVREGKGLYGSSLETTPVEMRPVVVQGMAKHMDDLVPGSAELIFGKPDTNGQYKTPTDKEIATMKRSSMTVPEQVGVNNAIALTQSTLDTQKLERAAMTGQPGIMPVELRTALGNKAAAMESTVGIFKSAQEAALSLSKDKAVGGFLGDKASSWMAEHLDDPRVGAIMTANAHLETTGKPVKMGQGWQMMANRYTAEATPMAAEAADIRKRSQGIEKPTAGQPAVPKTQPVTPAATTKPTSGPKPLTSRADFDALKSGDKFLDENGNVRTKK